MPVSAGCGASGFRHGHTGPPPVRPSRRGRGGEGVVGVDQDHPPPGPGGEVGGDVDDEVAFGVDDQHPASGGGVVADQMRHQGGLPGAGRADDLQVMPGIGHRHPDRAAGGGVAVAQRFHPRPGRRGVWGWRDGGGSGAQQPGHVLVDGQVGQRGQLRHRQHVTAPESASGDRGGRVAQVVAAVVVVSGERGERRRHRVRATLHHRPARSVRIDATWSSAGPRGGLARPRGCRG